MFPDVRLPLPFIAGGWGCLIADPPWRYGDQGSRISPDYPTMTVEEIAAIPIQPLVADRALCFLWATSSFVIDGSAAQVLRGWGFDPKCMGVWRKVTKDGGPHIGMGHYLRNAHEPFVVGARGGATALARDVPSIFDAPRSKHSEKPDRLYEIAERIAPAPRLELFARVRRDGWEPWGLEVA